MKKTDLTKLSVQDLKNQISSATENLTKMKIGNKVSPLENPLVIRYSRRQVARLNTELTKRESQA